jgi:hypothetical protein
MSNGKTDTAELAGFFDNPKNYSIGTYPVPKFDQLGGKVVYYDSQLAEKEPDTISSLGTRAGKVKANDQQIGGTHYLGVPVQTWDFIAANGLGYFEGNIVKYITRWREKGGLADLLKASHYLQKLIELHPDRQEGSPGATEAK